MGLALLREHHCLHSAGGLPELRQGAPEEFPFCPFCGAALTEVPPAPLREERKVITCLFCDLVDFTARAERLDPEEVRALLSPYYTHLRSELERLGGTVEKFIGDAVMALFGALVAHEDDPERAVRAALAIRDWIAEQSAELQVRIAVHTGEALVTLGARPNEGEAMAAGDVVNTAARLQAAAPLNGVLVGKQTHRATAHVIDYRAAEPGVPVPTLGSFFDGRPTQRGRVLSQASTSLRRHTAPRASSATGLGKCGCAISW